MKGGKNLCRNYKTKWSERIRNNTKHKSTDQVAHIGRKGNFMNKKQNNQSNNLKGGLYGK